MPISYSTLIKGFSVSSLEEAMGLPPKLCPKCKYHFLDYYNSICTGCQVMKIKEPQRFGKLKQSFGDFGELRQQKKEPKLEVFYLPVKTKTKFPIGGSATSREVEVLRSINNCSSDQINDFIRKVGETTDVGVERKNAEIILDYCYAELNRRLNP